MKAASLLKLSLSTLLAVATIPFCAAQANLAGNWEGTLDTGGGTFHIVWHAVAAPDGTLTSTFDNIDQSIYGIKVKNLSLKGSDLTMSVDDTVSINGQDVSIRGDFAGKLSSDGNTITGTWTQTDPAQPPAPIELKRVAPPAAPATAPASKPGAVGNRFGTLGARPAQLFLC
jgi:hypothetical protein